MFGRSRLKKSQQKKERRWRRPLKQVLVSFLILLPIAGLAYGTWYISKLPSLSINKIEVMGGETVAKTEVEKVAAAELNGYYYKIWPKRFAWTYPEADIKNKVLAIPRVKDATVGRLDGETISIVFSEYRPHALWCSAEDQSKCLFIDNTGRAFANAPALKGSAFLRLLDREKQPELSADNFGPDIIKYTEDLVIGLGTRFSFGVTHLEHLHKDDWLYYLSGGEVLKINVSQSVDENLNNLGAILSSKEFSHLSAGGFEYIDLRYGNKVFVKERSSVAASASSTDEMLAE